MLQGSAKGKKGSRRESRHKGFILQWLCCVRDFGVRIRENIFLAVFWSCRIYRSVSCIVELGWARLHFGSMRALLVWKIYGSVFISRLVSVYFKKKIQISNLWWLEMFVWIVLLYIYERNEFNWHVTYLMRVYYRDLQHGMIKPLDFIYWDDVASAP